MSKLLEIKDLNLWIGEKHLLKNLSLDLEAGEILALVGESGSGKTLLTKCILGLLPEKAEMTAAAFHKEEAIGAVFQNAFTSLNPTMRLGKQLEHLYRSHFGTKKGCQEKVESLMEQIGMKKDKDFLRKFPHELSGGEQQRMVILGALLREAKFLIADEVTTALDVETKQEILNLFLSLRESYGLGILFISHDLLSLEGFADRYAIMYKGELVAEDHPYAKRLFDLSKNIWRREV